MTQESILEILRNMNYPVDQANQTTSLGEDGIGLDSLSSLALSVELEETYNLSLTPEQVADLPNMTLGELIAMGK